MEALEYVDGYSGILLRELIWDTTTPMSHHLVTPMSPALVTTMSPPP